MSLIVALRRSRRRVIGRWRKFRNLAAGVDSTCFIGDGVRIARDIETGPYSFIGDHCRIGPGVTIGKYTMLAPEVAVVGADHVFQIAGCPITFSGRPELPRTIIGDDVWLGFRSIVMAGIRVGDGAIVAAGSVVTKDVPALEIWGGVPARFIRRRFSDADDEEYHRVMLRRPAFEGDACPPKMR
jgi:acetyltransferase-like isoleucine patch superfamily enzyme